MPVHHAVTGRHAHSACKRDAHPFLPCLKKAYRPQDQFSNSRGDASNPGFSDRCSDCGGNILNEFIAILNCSKF